MTQEQLWAPWRLSYITSPKENSDEGCFLCRYRESQADTENFVVTRGERTFVVLNRFPYNNGHLLIAPLAHVGSLNELDEQDLLECMLQLKIMTAALERTLNPQGFNVGLNIGTAAGAGLPGHLHWHIVPRWNGDTNFMSVIDDVTVIPQSLQALYDLLVQSLAVQNS